MFDIATPPPCLVDPTEVTAANELIVRYGVHAAQEAAQRAERSRDIGNHLHFCRWRQVGRLIDFLAAGRVGGTVH